MAATNFTPIQLYFSTTASAVPTAANLAQGELAINITDGKLYYEDNAGAVQVIATKGAGTIGGSTTQIQYNNAGALAGSAAMVFNNSTSVTTLTTLNLTNALGATFGGTAQSTYAQGDILYSSATNTLAKLGIGANTYILTSTGSIPQWVAPSSIAVLTATNLAGGAAGSVPYQSGVATTTFLAIGAADRVMTSSGTAPQWVTSLTGLTGVSSSSITNTSLTSGRVVVSTTAGLQADDADLTFDGTTLSAGGLSTVGLSTLVKTVKIGDSSFNGVAVFAAATPAKLYMGTGTVTDVTSAISATNAIGAIASLGITPIAATNTSVTYTNASTLYIAGAPSAGTNITITNPYSLYVAGGASYFGGTVDFAVTPSYSGGTANGVMFLNASKQITTGSALVFDSSDRLIVGAASAVIGNRVEVVGNSSGQAIGIRGRASDALGLISWHANAAATEYARISSDNTSALFFGVGASGTEQMRLTSSGLEIKQSQLIGYNSYAGIGTNGLAVAGKVGIGTDSPDQKLVVQGGAGLAGMKITDGTYSSFIATISSANNYGNGSLAGQLYLRGQSGIGFTSNSGGATQMALDSAGNLGLGVTPAAWLAATKAIQVGDYAAFSWDGYGGSTVVGNNVYQSGNTAEKYIVSGVAAAKYRASSGAHAWFYSTSAQVAGTDPVFTQAMTLDASGNLLIGTTTATGANLDVYESGSGDATIRVGNSQSGSVTSVGKQGSSTYGATSAGDSFLYTDKALSIMADGGANGIIKFSTGGNTERARITSTGVLAVNYPGAVLADGNFVVYGSNGTGQGAANTVAQANFIEATSGNAAGLWIGAMTNENTAVIGTRTATGNLAFQTYNGGWGERMRLTSTGDLLVGATSSLSSAKLDVRGIIRTGSGNSTNDAELVFSNYASATSAWNISVRQDTGSANNDLKFLRFNSSGTFQGVAMQIDSAGGNLIVGGTVPVTNNGGITATTTSSGSIQSTLAMRNAGTANGSGTTLVFRGVSNTSAEHDYAYVTMVADDTTAKTGSIRFSTTAGSSPIERARITSAGYFLVGATSYAGAGAKGIQIGDTSSVATQILTQSTTTHFSLYASSGADVYATYASGAALLFGTGPANLATFAEHARITSAGNLLVGTASTSPASSNVVGFAVNNSGFISLTGSATSAIDCNRTNDGIIQAFRQSGNIVGNIAVTTSATTYNTTSDYRLKTVIGAVADSGSRIDALQPVEYTWNSNGTSTRGFLAHQFQEVYAGSVTGTKDAVDAEGKPVYQQMQASTAEVIADLIAEIQSLRKRLAALEAK